MLVSGEVTVLDVSNVSMGGEKRGEMHARFERHSTRRVSVAVVLGVVVSVGAVLGGCDDKKKTEGTAPSAVPNASVAAPSMSAMPMASAITSAGADLKDAATTEAADLAGKAPARDMAHCPTAAPGANVTVKDVEGGVEVAITGKDEATTKDIRERMTKLAEADRNEAKAGVKHTGKGEGGGQYGRCTIVMRNTKLESAEIANGVKATVKAKDAKEVDWLRRETRERDKEAKSPAAEGAGKRRMAHCPSAVEGAKTAVKDTKDGVVVTVTGTGTAVNEIRSRAQHTSEISKLPEAPQIEHNSEGRGGGGIGRCPVIVEGDTLVEAKDVEGGSEITVKAKKDTAVGNLQKEAKLRAGNFTK